MTILWGLWVLMFLILEGYAVFDGRPNDTLTQTTLHVVPWELILVFLGWLAIHFSSRVWRNRSGKQDGL